jgi:hypothetical protein
MPHRRAAGFLWLRPREVDEPGAVVISSSLRTLDGVDGSGSSDRISSTVARWRRCTMSMIWLSRLVRWICGGFNIGNGELFRRARIYSPFAPGVKGFSDLSF